MQNFSIIIPVYNEEEIIKQNTFMLLSYLKNEFPKKKYEIIICSNGSNDKTNQIGIELSKKNKLIKFISLNQKGAGIAFKHALNKAKYDFLISIDMDLSTDLSFINQALELSFSNDIIIGSKRLGNQKRFFLRTFLSKSYLFLVRLLLGLRYNDYSISSKAYKKDSIKNMLNNDNGTFYVIRIIYIAYKRGLSIIEIPVNCFDKRKSKFNIFNEVFYRFWKLIKLSIEKPK
jgi:glycosyltransferase involved in cell wall biosynthesis